MVGHAPTGYERTLAVEELSMYRQERGWRCGRIARVAQLAPHEVAKLESVVAGLAGHPFLARVLEAAADEVRFRGVQELRLPTIELRGTTTSAEFLNEILGAAKFEGGEPLARVFVGGSIDGRSHLGLLVHHALTDGRAASAIMGEILARVAGQPRQDFGVHPSTPASDLVEREALASSLDAYIERSAEQIFGEGFRIPPGDGEDAVERSTARLLTGNRSELRALAGVERASTTAAVMFMLARAVAAEYDATTTQLTAGFTADGRALLGLPSNALGAYQLGGLVRLDVAADPAVEITRLGGEIRGQASDPSILASLELQSMALEQMTSATESLVPLVVSHTGGVPRAPDVAVWGCVPYHCFGSAVYASVVGHGASLNVTVVVPAGTELDRRTPALLDRLAASTGLRLVE